MRIAINGFGRIGRCVLRALFERGLDKQLSVFAIHEPAEAETIAHLFRYDSTHGRFRGEVALSADKSTLEINDYRIPLFTSSGISGDMLSKVDVLLECSGVIQEREQAMALVAGSEARVVFSHPAESDVDATVVFGYNQHLLKTADRFISNASCTTNCIVPVIAALDDALGVESGVITTIHSAMNDQPVIDAYHHTDLRKTRAASQSIIPVDTGLAAGIDRLMPSLAGRFSAQAMRVPTLNVSAMDLSLLVSKDTTVQEINRVLLQATKGRFNGVLAYTDEPLASCDFNHDPHSGIVDASQTRVSGKRLIKVLTWFDNEWGYANRMLDLLCYLKQLDAG